MLLKASSDSGRRAADLVSRRSTFTDASTRCDVFQFNGEGCVKRLLPRCLSCAVQDTLHHKQVSGIHPSISQRVKPKDPEFSMNT